MEPMVATQATLDPVTAPNAPQAQTEAMANPPGRRPSHLCRNSYSSEAIPVEEVSWPMKMKRGMQTMMKSVPLSQAMRTIWDKVWVTPATRAVPMIPTTAMEKAMGTPRTSRPSITMIPIIPMVIGSIIFLPSE